jgi:lipopolysaccharide/colanic/teichoic acid biosynthesis glycosyltransferase
MKYELIKRLLDYLFLILVSPLVLVIVVFFSFLIKLFNPKDKIFFIQERVGYKGKVFKIFKFRTMYSSSKNNLFTSNDDPRIDRLGTYLRRFRIDEVPQFFNIFFGDMSLIGPRPEQVHFAQKLSEKYGARFNRRHDILPGITGLAQVEHGYVADFDDYSNKIDFDLLYINNLSLKQDVKIFFKTFQIVFSKIGSR